MEQGNVIRSGWIRDRLTGVAAVGAFVLLVVAFTSVAGLPAWSFGHGSGGFNCLDSSYKYLNECREWLKQQESIDRARAQTLQPKPGENESPPPAPLVGGGAAGGDTCDEPMLANHPICAKWLKEVEVWRAGRRVVTPAADTGRARAIEQL